MRKCYTLATIPPMRILSRWMPQTRWRSVLSWLLRVLIMVGAFEATNLPGVHVTLGPQQTVETQHPITCVHTRLTDEVEAWKIQRSLQLVREMGAPTIVEFFPWAYIEGNKGHYDWRHSDLIVAHARQQGLTIIARLGLVPDWAFAKTDDPATIYPANLLTPDHVPDFAAFVEAFTHRYQGQIGAIIVWNEPNLSFEWGYQPVDPQRYVDLLTATYPAAHRGNPDVVVLGGALSPTLEPVGSQYGMNDLEYLRRIYGLGAGAYFDALAVHAYGLKFPPDDPPAPEALNFRRVELVRQIMIEFGDAKKPVFITESGWNDHPRWTKAVRPGQRITYTITALEYAEKNWLWARSVCIWTLRYPAPTRSYPDYYQLVTPDFTRLPIYDALQAWARESTQP
jgi:polysaccharide biosynthesis protein PslG